MLVMLSSLTVICLKTNEDIALQSSRIYRRLCSGFGGGLGEGVGTRLCLSF